MGDVEEGGRNARRSYEAEVYSKGRKLWKIVPEPLCFEIEMVSSESAAPHRSVPRIRALTDGTATSTNWSGYAVTGPAGSVTDAKGSWIVPSVSCSSVASYSSFWVGIDGFGSSTVEQIGTDSDCSGGSPTYYAWYEFYPGPAFLISGITVRPGDRISAEAIYSSGLVTVTITDTRTGQSFTTSGGGGALRTSAEWIAEAPSSVGGVLPLANFGQPTSAK